MSLAAIALRMIEVAAPPFYPDRPLFGLAALERAVRGHARIAWALRLIWALRAKLTGDLARVECGEGVDEVLAAEARPALVVRAETDPQTEAAAERREASGRESEGLERESFAFLSRRSGEAEFAEILKRPTHEVIALIREALGLSPAQSEPPTGFRDEEAWPGLVPRAVVPPPPSRPAPGLRSPCQV